MISPASGSAKAHVQVVWHALKRKYSSKKHFPGCAQNVRKDFVSGVLSEEELGQQLHVHELHRDYAACVLNLRAYDAISRDVIQVVLPPANRLKLAPCSSYQGARMQ